jgi:WD40 repeat protein
MVFGVALSGDGRCAVSASNDNTLKVWDVESGREVVTFTCDSRVLCCAFVSETLMAGDAGGRVHCLRLEE